MRSRLFEFIKQKELQEHRSISVSEIMEETKLARNTLKAWLSNKPLEVIYVDTAIAIAKYVGCEWHELCEPIEFESEN